MDELKYLYKYLRLEEKEELSSYIKKISKNKFIFFIFANFLGIKSLKHFKRSNPQNGELDDYLDKTVIFSFINKEFCIFDKYSCIDAYIDCGRYESEYDGGLII